MFVSHTDIFIDTIVLLYCSLNSNLSSWKETHKAKEANKHFQAQKPQQVTTLTGPSLQADCLQGGQGGPGMQPL